MPASDINFMLRDGSTVLAGSETGDWIFWGALPLHRMQVMIHFPTDGTSAQIYVEAATDSAGTGAVALDGWNPRTLTAGAKTYKYNLDVRPNYTYFRYRSGTVTGAFGAVQIGPVVGDMEIRHA